MADTGAVSGVSPVTQAGARDGQSRVPLPGANTTAQAPAQAALADARAAMPEPAVAIAASLLGLKVGQEVRGTVVRAPGSAKPMLRTPQGDFAVEPASALPESGEVTLVLTRADRLTAALLTALGSEMLDSPQALRLELLAQAEAPPNAPIDPDSPTSAPRPSDAATARIIAPLPGGINEQGLVRIGLMSDAPPLRAAGSLAGLQAPDAPPPGRPAEPAAPTTQTPANTAPHAGSAKTLVPSAAPATLPGSVDSSALAALMETGTVELQPEGRPGARPLTVSLIAAAGPGEETPLTHPPTHSPVARLAIMGRLVTARVMDPPAATPELPRHGQPGQPGQQASVPPTGRDEPAAMRVAVGGRLHLWPLPPGTSQPAPGTQLVLLITSQGDASPPQENAARPQESAAPRRAEAGPTGGTAQTRADAGTAQIRPDGGSVSAKSDADSAHQPGPAPIIPPLAGDEAALAPLPPLLAAGGTVGGVGLAASSRAAPGDGLIQSLLRALGRAGFSVDTSPNGQADAAQGKDTSLPAMDAARRLAEVSIQGLQELSAIATKGRRASETLPDALPLAITLQTPHGAMPLVMLVWQPPESVREDGRGSQDGGQGQDICFAMEVDFGIYGPLRLRGDVTPRHLRLAVETESPLEPALQHSTRAAFTSAVEAGGMTGILTFRHRTHAA